MREAITVAPRTIEVREAPDPAEPGPGEALLRIASVGICGSDVGLWDGSDPYAAFPIRQGHEFSARIGALGPGDTGGLAVGTLVAVEPLLPDGTCVACRRGRPNCCVGLRVYGAHVPGAFADALVVPTRNLYPVIDLTPDLAAFVEPVSIGLQMVTRSGVVAGERAVIFGAGPIGQAVALVLRDRGVRFATVDIVPGRLDRAVEGGADLAIDARREDVAATLDRWTAGDGPTVAFEATGVPAVMRQAVESVAHGGVVVVAGTSDEAVALPSLLLVKKELDVRGSRNNAGLYGEAVALVRRHRERCQALITQRYPLAELPEAMRFADAEPAAVNKIVIEVAS